jgi:hypothetical protein
MVWLTGAHPRQEAVSVLRQQVVSVRCNRAIRENVVVGVGGDDVELEGGRYAEEVCARVFPKTIIPCAIRRALGG